jgi:hypothetical protein
VINFVYWLSKPAVISDSEIEIIKRVLNRHRNIKLENSSYGPIVGHEGQIFSIKDKTIKIILPSLGYLMIAEEETADEEVPVRNFADKDDLLYPIYAVK